MKSKNKKKKVLSLLLCAVMLFSFIPQGMALASGSESDSLCEHHTEHTADCGYSEGTAGSPCTHEHTEDCYTEGELTCKHEHDGECGYVPELKEMPCTYECEICNQTENDTSQNAIGGGKNRLLS